MDLCWALHASMRPRVFPAEDTGLFEGLIWYDTALQ